MAYLELGMLGTLKNISDKGAAVASLVKALQLLLRIYPAGHEIVSAVVGIPC